MATEQYANSAQTTLSAGITSSDGTLSVASATLFPATGVFRILIDSELIRVVSVSGTTFTVSRGVEGTTAASHSSGATVTQVLSRDGLLSLGSQIHASDSYFALPSSSIPGRTFWPTNGSTLFRDDGSLWHPFGPSFPMTSLIDSQFSWVNQGSATLDLSHGGAILATPAGAATDNLHLRMKTIPSAPYTITMACIPLIPFPSNFNACGLALRDSGTGKIITFAVSSDSTQVPTNLVLSGIKWTDATTFSAFYTLTPTAAADYASLVGFRLGPCLWLQIKDDNSNRSLRISNDGISFQSLHSVGRTDFITPDQIGFFVNQQNASFGLSLNVLSWTEGS